MVLASIFFAGTPLLLTMMTYPLAIGGACIITSIIGTFFVRLGRRRSIMGALYKGFIASALLSLVAVWFVTDSLIGFGRIAGVNYSTTGQALFICAIVGLAVTGLIIWITEYYTGTNFRPVRSIASASVTGHGTNIIQGLAVSRKQPRCPR
jgi:K(+)-stimulated pyrophosphate-energized sodium pump